MNPTAGIFSDEILKQADACRAAETQYDRQFSQWAEGIPALDPSYFWPEVAKLREIWVDRKFDAERAADEYLRQAQCKGEEQFAAAVDFAVSYRKYVDMLHKAAKGVYSGWERGDDSYSDLMDVLPMAGQRIHEGVVNGEYFDDDEVDIARLGKDVIHAVGLECGGKILHGEHYMATSLEDEARDRLRFVLCQRSREFL